MRLLLLRFVVLGALLAACRTASLPGGADLAGVDGGGGGAGSGGGQRRQRRRQRLGRHAARLHRLLQSLPQWAVLRHRLLWHRRVVRPDEQQLPLRRPTVVHQRQRLRLGWPHPARTDVRRHLLRQDFALPVISEGQKGAGAALLEAR
jgi:hypothetical protein